MDNRDGKSNFKFLDEATKLNAGGPRLLTPTQSNILNLSLTYILNESEQSLLEKGLSFIPTPLGVDKNCLRRDLYRYHRRLKLLEKFNYTTTSVPERFVEPSKWEPEWNSVSEPIKHLIRDDIQGLENISYGTVGRNNLSRQQRQALKKLKRNQDIVIKSADKGSKIVIMDKNQYLTEAKRQLNNSAHYIPLTRSLQLETQSKIRGIVTELYDKKYISSKQRFYLFGSDPPRPRKFYLLPKIHKDPRTWTVPHEIPPGRPIVSDCGSESCRVAEYIDFFLNPLSQKHSSYVKDTYEFVNKIKTIDVPPGAMLFSIDIDSLYTNIDTQLGLKAVRQAFIKYPDPTRPDEALISLLELGLTQNDFEFDSRYYLQVHGTAMGKKFAPAYANIYMADWERTVFPKCRKVPLLYIRYLDDIFGVWCYSESDFEQFISVMNGHHDSITVKYNLQAEKIEFLDTEVFIMRGEDGKGSLGTRVYFKPTDTHALLHKTSYHPKHTYKGIVKSQLIRFNRICTKQEDVELATAVLFKALRPRGYSRSFLRSIKTEVQQVQRSERTNRNNNIIPFVSTFSSTSLKLNSIVKTHFQRLQDAIEPLSNLKIISAFKRNKNLKDLLVHASLVSERQQKNAHFRSIKFLMNKHTNLSAPVWQSFQLDSSNLVYVIECRVCNKLYIGQTKNKLLQRLKQHIYYIDRSDKLTELYVHFRTHGRNNLTISGLESGVGWSRSQRFATERHWIRKLKTVLPNGLNELG